MQEINLKAITTDKLIFQQPSGRVIEAAMLRLDKIHPLISGNKWFKLRYYLEDAIQLNKKKIITFGGAWSGHILATAAACQLYKLKCIAIVRGEKPGKLSDTLQQAMALGMQLVFISRKDYSIKKIPAELNDADNYIIQQGGFGEIGAQGAADILNYCSNKKQYTHICCAVGTGTMLAGLVAAAHPAQRVIGINILKNNFQTENDVKKLSNKPGAHFSLIHDYHFGGYAKHTPALISFMNDWYRQNRIPTDFVYTGKLCFAINDLAGKDFFPEGSRLLLIHSGGLTGNTSLKKGTLIF